MLPQIREWNITYVGFNKRGLGGGNSYFYAARVVNLSDGGGFIS
jgi:hypothetical protein